MKVIVYLLATLMLIGIASATEDLMAIQGIMESSTGSVIDGVETVNVSLITSDSSLLWNESKSKNIINGLYDDILGFQTAITPHTIMLATNWSIKIDNEAPTITPPITKAPKAFVCDLALNLTGAWKVANFTDAHDDEEHTNIRNSIEKNRTATMVNIADNITAIITSIGNNWSNLNDNITIIWGNLSSMNNSLGIKLEAGDLLAYALDSDVLNNWTNLNANDTQIWLNISNLNTTLGQKYDRGDNVLDGTKIANGTDASLIKLNVTNINITDTADFYILNRLFEGWLWGAANFTTIHTDNTIHNYYQLANFSSDYTTYGGFKLENLSDVVLSIENNWSNLNDNLTQIWINISSINNSKGSGGGLDGSKIANNTDAILTNLTIVENMTIQGLISCDTIDTDSTGRLTCGTDNSGAGVGNDIYAGIEQNISNVRGDIDNNISAVRTDWWELINFTGAFNAIYNITNKVEGENVEDNITAARVSIADNVTELQTSINNNWTNLNDNDTQIWLNITSLNTTLGQKYDRGESVADGTKIANGTDASLIKLNVTNLNVTNEAEFLGHVNMSKNLTVGSQVGIGISPKYNLHIKSSSKSSIPMFITESDGNNLLTVIESSAGAGGLQLFDSGSSPTWVFQTNTADSYFNGVGVFGIKKTTPTYPLDVEGYINSSGLTIANFRVNISAIGDVNATKFYGDGSGLTNVPATLAGAYQELNFTEDYNELGIGWKLANFTSIHTDNTIHNYWVKLNATEQFNTLYNLTAPIENATDATLVTLNTTNLNVESNFTMNSSIASYRWHVEGTSYILKRVA